MKKISFCVPVYNRVDKVEKCILSLIHQTEPSENYEIIVVDDCSTDGTYEKIESILKENNFQNYKLIKLENNSGNASTPRNKAVEHAEGEYLFFVDSDDYVAKELVTNIYDFAKRNNSDIVFPKYAKGNKEGINVPGAFAQYGSLDNANIVDNQLLYALSVLKAFKRSEWDRLNLEFHPEILIGEDMIVTTKFLFNTKVHSVLADQPYYYIVHHTDERLTSSQQTRERTLQNYKEIFEIIYEGTFGTADFKDRASARFVNRIMHYGLGNHIHFLNHNHDTDEQTEWLEQFANLYNNFFPERAEKYLNKRFYNRIRAIRDKDANAVRLAYQSELQELKIKKLEEKINSLIKENKQMKDKINSLTTTSKKESKSSTKIDKLRNKIANKLKTE